MSPLQEHWSTLLWNAIMHYSTALRQCGLVEYLFHRMQVSEESKRVAGRLVTDHRRPWMSPTPGALWAFTCINGKEEGRR